MAETLDTQLNVFADFDPKIPADFRASPIVFLGKHRSGAAASRLAVGRSPGAHGDGHDEFWISSKRDAVTEVMRSVDLVMMNDAELRQYAQVRQLIWLPGAILDLGPRAVIVKKGDNGCALFTRERYFVAPAYPVEKVCDPTGAGDSFAGAFIGCLARTDIAPRWRFGGPCCTAASSRRLPSSHSALTASET